MAKPPKDINDMAYEFALHIAGNQEVHVDWVIRRAYELSENYQKERLKRQSRKVIRPLRKKK